MVIFLILRAKLLIIYNLRVFYMYHLIFFMSHSPERDLFGETDKRKVATDIHIRVTTMISLTITNSFYKN